MVTTRNSAVVSPCAGLKKSVGHHRVHRAPVRLPLNTTFPCGQCCPSGLEWLWPPSMMLSLVDALRNTRWVVSTADCLSNSWDKPPLTCWQKLPSSLETENSRFSIFDPLCIYRMSMGPSPGDCNLRKNFLCNKTEMHGRKKLFSSSRYWDCGSPHGCAQGQI